MIGCVMGKGDGDDRWEVVGEMMLSVCAFPNWEPWNEPCSKMAEGRNTVNDGGGNNSLELQAVCY